MKLTRNGVIAIMVSAAFFAGSVVTVALAGGGAESAKKKSKRGPRGPQGPAGPQGAAGAAGQNTTNVVPIDYFAVGGTATTTPIFSANGFSITASCPGAVDSLYSTSGPGALYIKWTTFGSSADSTNASGGESDSYTKATDDAGISDIFGSDDLVGDGQMVYDPNGRGVTGGKPITIVFHMEESGAGCSFTGTATVSA